MTRPSMFERVLGERYARLPPALQRFHRLAGQHAFEGWADAAAPSSAAARLLARCLGTPCAAVRGALRFELDAGPDREVWVRHFPTASMTSRLRLHGGRLVESFGPLRLTFELTVSAGRLRFELAGVRMLGLRCPRALMPRIVADEWADGGRLHFEVQATLPGVGRVAGYRGHLETGGPG